MSALRRMQLVCAAPRRVLALGAYLKNTACLLEADQLTQSVVHGDLGCVESCAALADSVEQLLQQAGGKVDAVAHDLHPDFASSRLARQLAERLGVPAIAVQHHHAHIAVVQAEQGTVQPVVGLALDGVGLGLDGSAWGGELLWVAGEQMRRLDHLGVLCLPGGDIAAREPWRMAAAVLHMLGKEEEIVPRFAPVVGEQAARVVQTMLARQLNCPLTSSAGRWFDAAAGLLGISVRQAAEAEAAIALEQLASDWLDSHVPVEGPACGLDLLPLMDRLLACNTPAQGAAFFHLGLARGLADRSIKAACAHGSREVVLAGGCFYNRLLSRLLVEALQAEGIQTCRPQVFDCGDAGLAVGQAWVAAHQLHQLEQNDSRGTPACA